MTLLALIDYPRIDPVAFTLVVRWYALAYIAGLVLGWQRAMAMTAAPPHLISRPQIDEFLGWATLGVVLGGRTGYVLFYRPGHYLAEPLDALMVWHGGMSFHGGCAGVAIAMWLYARRSHLSLLGLADIVATVAPFGLFFGRLANFVNGELYGRPTDVPWAMIFPTDPDQVPRHPSQLYQAGLEGLVLGLVLFGLDRLGYRRRPGVLTGAFLIGYALARATGEFFRQPDPQLGFLVIGTTMGQLLSLPMLAGGLWLIRRAQPLASAGVQG